MQRSVLYPFIYFMPVGELGHLAVRRRTAVGTSPGSAAPAQTAVEGTAGVGHGTIRMGTHVKGVSFAPSRLPSAPPPTRETAGAGRATRTRIDIR